MFNPLLRCSGAARLGVSRTGVARQVQPPRANMTRKRVRLTPELPVCFA
jgi:hypothetical protein